MLADLVLCFCVLCKDEPVGLKRNAKLSAS